MKKLLIVGAGGFGREVACWATAASERGSGWKPVGFLDDNPRAVEGKSTTIPLLGRVSDFVPEQGTVLIVAVGLPGIRRQIHEKLATLGARFASVVHPTAVVASSAHLGAGVVLAPYSVVSADARLEDGVVLNFHAVVEHDARMGRWSQLNCHASLCGGATLGEGVLVGAHALIPARTHLPGGVNVVPGSVFTGV